MTKVTTKDGTVLVGDKVHITTIGETVWVDFYDYRGNFVKTNSEHSLRNAEIESIEINGKVFIARG